MIVEAEDTDQNEEESANPNRDGYYPYLVV